MSTDTPENDLPTAHLLDQKPSLIPQLRRYKTKLSNDIPALIEQTSPDLIRLEYDHIVDDKVTPKSAVNRLMSPKEAEELLHKHENDGDTDPASTDTDRVRVRWQQNHLPMKDEDRSSIHTLTPASFEAISTAAGMAGEDRLDFWRKWHAGSYTAGARGKGEDKALVVLASIFDGVQGSYAAEMINRVMHPCIAYALQHAGSPTKVEEVKKVLTDVYEAIGFLHSHAAATHLGITPDSTSSYSFLPPYTGQLLNPGALFSPQTGTTAITALIDIPSRKLYVVNLGDCRAVAGWYHPDTDRWECDVLSEDMTPENPNEATRLAEERPETPPEILIRDRGFPHGIFGFGSHTRSFSGAMQRVKGDILGPAAEAMGESIPQWYSNFNANHQPYTSVTPQITVRDLDQGHRQLKFVILASDGLWDRLTSEEAVLLTAAYLERQSRGPQLQPTTISKVDLPLTLSMIPPQDNDERSYPAQPIPGSDGRDRGDWVFQDSSAATHLLRNAIGDGDEELRRMVLSLQAPEGRTMRDDMTTTGERAARLMLQSAFVLILKHIAKYL